MLDLVPLVDLKLEKRWPRLHELQNELVGLEQHRRRAEEQSSTLSSGLASARERDLSEAAQALRAGEDLPGNVHEDAIVAELEQARRDMGIYGRAVSAVQTDIGALRARHQVELFNDVMARRAEIGNGWPTPLGLPHPSTGDTKAFRACLRISNRWSRSKSLTSPREA